VSHWKFEVRFAQGAHTCYQRSQWLRDGALNDPYQAGTQQKRNRPESDQYSIEMADEPARLIERLQNCQLYGHRSLGKLDLSGQEALAIQLNLLRSLRRKRRRDIGLQFRRLNRRQRRTDKPIARPEGDLARGHFT